MITPDEPRGDDRAAMHVERAHGDNRRERAPRRQQPPAPAARAWCVADDAAKGCRVVRVDRGPTPASHRPPRARRSRGFRSRCSRTRAARPTDSAGAGWPERHASARADAASDRSRPSKCSATNSSARRRSAAPSSGLGSSSSASARSSGVRSGGGGGAGGSGGGGSSRRGSAAYASRPPPSRSPAAPARSSASSNAGDRRYDAAGSVARSARQAVPYSSRRPKSSETSLVFITSTGQRTSVDARPPPTWS